MFHFARVCRSSVIHRLGCWSGNKKRLYSYNSCKSGDFKNRSCVGYANAIDGILKREPKVARAIWEHTEITRNHMTPEIQLFLLTPSCELYDTPYERILEDEVKRHVFSEPFWSIYWPGGQALARFVLNEGRQLVSSSENVLDLGAGCGAASIAAKLVGAKRVLANDIDEVACTAILMNAAVNNLDVEVSEENLLYKPPETTDIILIGDMLYDEEIADILIPWLQKARRNGTRIYLGDPGRHGLTGDLKKRMKILKHYSLPENVRKENYGYDTCNVWEFCG